MSSAALAQGAFDAQGKLVWPPPGTQSIVTQSFDGNARSNKQGIAFLNQQFRRTGGGSPHTQFQDVPQQGSLHGTPALRMGNDVAHTILTISQIPEAELVRQRIRASFWYRARGSAAVAEMIYSASSALDTPERAFGGARFSVKFYPTGRATDDGWVELSTGPVDAFLQNGRNPNFKFKPRLVRISKAAALDTLVGGPRPPSNSAVWIDAFMIESVGAQAVSPNSCTLMNQNSVCGVEGACFGGSCVDAAPILGNVPETQRIHEEYLARQAFRLKNFAGGRVPQQRAQNLRQGLLSVPKENLENYWRNYNRAHDNLADGHLSTPLTRFSQRLPAPACLYLATPDSSSTQAGVLPMVVKTGYFSGQLRPGDIVERIDNVLPEAWINRAGAYLSYSGDQIGRYFILTAELLAVAVQTNATLRMSRCRQPNDDGSCASENREFFNFRPGALDDTYVMQGSQPAWWQNPRVTCDFRITRLGPDNPSDLGDEVEFADEADSIRRIQISGVSGQGGWASRVRRATRDIGNRVLLDQRTGFGGTFTGVEMLLGPFLSASERPMVELVPQMNPEYTAQDRSTLQQCSQNAGEVCGGFFQLDLINGNPVRRVPNARVAIVNGRDVSGNDYLPFSLKAREGGFTRIFGPVPTYGAFGPILTLPRIAGEIIGGSVQYHDTIFRRDRMDPNLTFHTGRGVPPDVSLYQKQSDLYRGRDTLLEAARAWLRGDE